MNALKIIISIAAVSLYLIAVLFYLRIRLLFTMETYRAR